MLNNKYIYTYIYKILIKCHIVIYYVVSDYDVMKYAYTIYCGYVCTYISKMTKEIINI